MSSGASTNLLKGISQQVQGDIVFTFRLITEMEHHANLVPWQELSKDLGTVLKIIPMNDEGVLDLDAYASLLSEKTKFVSLIHVSNA